MIRNGFHHVALRSKDFEKTIAFYEALGGKLARTWGEAPNLCAMVDIGGCYIEVFSGMTEDAESHPRFEHIALKSTDPDADYANALAAGAKPHIEPKNANLGGNYPIRIAFVIGPSDEIVEFFQEL